MLTLQNSEHGVCITQELKSAFDGHHPCDLKLICADNEIILAHRLILAAASPFLRKLLAETEILNDNMISIHFPEISIFHFRLLLNFLYSGETWVSPKEANEFKDLLVLLEMDYLNTFDILNGGSSKRGNDNSKNFCSLQQDRSENSNELLVAVKCERSDDGYSDFQDDTESPYITPSNSFKTEPLSPADKTEDDIFDSDDYDTDTNYEQQCMQSSDQYGDSSIKLKETTEYQCNHCQRKFKLLSHLRGHLRVHICEKPFKCSLCTAQFTSKYNVFRHVSRKHQKKHSKKNQDKYPCSYCSQSFDSRSNLVQHFGKKHTNLCVDQLTSNYTTPKIEYACPHCKVKFLRTIYLFKHMYTKHENIMKSSTTPNSYICCFCTLLCASKMMLNNHIRKDHVHLLIHQNLHSSL